MVSYSRLIGIDEAGTIARQKTHRDEVIDPEIAKHRGRIVKTTGDGILVEFASAVDAVLCAVAIQRAMSEREAQIPDDQRIAYRIGINLGEIVIDGEDILGDGVNIAARLEGLAEPGGIRISDVVFRNVKGKLDLGFADLGPQKVKNIAEPVPTYRVLIDPADVGKIVAARPGNFAVHRWKVGAAITVLLLAVAVGLAIWRPGTPRTEPMHPESLAYPLPEKPSIAVLPFTNMSDDPSQDYFADGMTEDLITDLSKISGLFVIARNSVFTYKGKAVKTHRVAEELGVRYVLEGSVRRAGDQVRINAQLIDATTGGHLWAERYDGTLADVFKLQDRVTAQIVASLSVTLNPGEQALAEQVETSVPDAYDAFLTGWRHFRLRTVDDYRTALTWFEKAVTLDPDYGRAWAALASLHLEAFQRSWLGELGIEYTRLPELLDKALKRPTPLAYQVEAERLMMSNRLDEAATMLDKASALDPNDPDTYVTRSDLVAMQGDADGAIDLMNVAMRLDPHYPAFDLYILGTHYLRAGDVARAIEFLERAQARNPEDWYHLLYLAAAYAEVGRLDDANKAAKALVQRRKELGFPFTTVGGFSHWSTFTDAFGKRIMNGLRKAGLPDQMRAEDLNLPPERRLTGAALREFIFCDCRHKGQGEGGIWMRDLFSDGTGIHYWQGQKTSTTTSEIRNDVEFSKRSNGRETECSFYRNPKGTKESLDEFIGVCAHGVYPMAEFPLPDAKQ